MPRQPFLRSIATVIFIGCGTFLFGADPKPAALTEKEIADGWILLFDGESTFGWTGKAEAKAGMLHVARGGKLDFVAVLPLGEAVCEVKGCRVDASSRLYSPVDTEQRLSAFVDPAGDESFTTISATRDRAKDDKLVIEVRNVTDKSRPVSKLELGGPAIPEGWRLRIEGLSERGQIKGVKFRPTKPAAIFNGKDLAGWKVFKDEKRAKSTWDVTAAGELALKNGPGDLQTEKQYDNFLLQLECKTNGAALNSGVFFRCIANQYQNGYEMQIQNAYENGDRTKPKDFGTGAIYRRVPARKVVSNDKEWFAMTLLAHGPNIATWVNGYPVLNWKDERAPNDNPRQGLRTAKGHLSIQGHDPTTDILFRNLRVVEVK